MKTLICISCILFSFASTSFAVLWDVVTFSATVYQSAGNVQKVVLTNRDYINAVAAANSTPKRKLVVVLSEADGRVCVVRKTDQAILYTIIGTPAGNGAATNSASTNIFATGGINIASLNTVFAGFGFAHITRRQTGATISATLSFSGGNGGQVIKGSLATTGDKFNF